MALLLCFSLPETNISGAIVGVSSSGAEVFAVEVHRTRDRHRLGLAARRAALIIGMR
jgi:hypothetical protein